MIKHYCNGCTKELTENNRIKEYIGKTDDECLYTIKISCKRDEAEFDICRDCIKKTLTCLFQKETEEELNTN